MENLSFRTKSQYIEETNQIDYSSQIVLFGSCFTEKIGEKLDYLKYKSSTNPYGILFNPISIENAILECIENKNYTEKDLIFHEEYWHSFNHHSDFSSMESKLVLEKINSSIKKAHCDLKNASHIIITYGTAWVYEYLDTKTKVANCHKIPQKKFAKKLISPEEIEKSISSIKEAIKKLNPNSTVIFTLSPVRHLKNGMVENSLSKACLLTAIHKSIDKSSRYFHAFEIMMDDLRDYRFYSDDMIHPNALAVTYIWSVFKEIWISKKTNETSRRIEDIQKSLNHRPFNTQSKEYNKFKEKLTKKITLLNTEVGRTLF